MIIGLLKQVTRHTTPATFYRRLTLRVSVELARIDVFDF